MASQTQWSKLLPEHGWLVVVVHCIVLGSGGARYIVHSGTFLCVVRVQVVFALDGRTLQRQRGGARGWWRCRGGASVRAGQTHRRATAARDAPCSHAGGR